METNNTNTIVASNSSDTKQKLTVLNIGVLGHIDSGKTSLCANLSTVLSTAALDKSPQSVERGITLDLQFSAFTLDVPEDCSNPNVSGLKKILVSLVDCPGHASLIRTIIGGAQIIDMVLLVIDVTKGIQTQTAEGIVVAEVTTNKMVIVLNKIDLLPPDEAEARMNKVTATIKRALAGSKFADAPIIPYAARPSTTATNNSAVSVLHGAILAAAPALTRTDTEPAHFLMLVDHCFALKGKGTVCTGTVLRGSISVGQSVEFPNLGETKKVKSIHIFHAPHDSAHQGDRIGMLVTQLDSQQLERGYACYPGAIHNGVTHVLSSVQQIKYFKGDLASQHSLHVTIGHYTTTARIVFMNSAVDPTSNEFTWSAHEYPYVAALPSVKSADAQVTPVKHYLALIEFDKPMLVPPRALLIASKLDADIHLNQCRIAFSGHVISTLQQSQLTELKIYKTKIKRGEVERMNDARNAIGRNLFKKETDMNKFTTMHVTVEREGAVIARGVIEGAFGKSGKFKVRITQLESGVSVQPRDQIVLALKRYTFDKTKRNYQ